MAVCANHGKVGSWIERSRAPLELREGHEVVSLDVALADGSVAVGVGEVADDTGYARGPSSRPVPTLGCARSGGAIEGALPLARVRGDPLTRRPGRPDPAPR